MTTSKLPPLSWLAASFQRWAGRRLIGQQQAHARLELKGMSDHELNDLGIGRSEVHVQVESDFQR